MLTCVLTCAVFFLSVVSFFSNLGTEKLMSTTKLALGQKEITRISVYMFENQIPMVAGQLEEPFPSKDDLNHQ